MSNRYSAPAYPPPTFTHDGGPSSYLNDPRPQGGYYSPAPLQQGQYDQGDRAPYQQGPYGPPQGPYTQQPMMYQQQPPMYGPQGGYYDDRRGYGGGAGEGLCAGLLAALTCCCCVDFCLF